MIASSRAAGRRAQRRQLGTLDRGILQNTTIASLGFIVALGEETRSGKDGKAEKDSLGRRLGHHLCSKSFFLWLQN